MWISHQHRNPANYWIKNEDIDAEFAGLLNIIREDGSYRFVGELEILRGEFPFRQDFRIIPIPRVYLEDVEYPNPASISGRPREYFGPHQRAGAQL